MSEYREFSYRVEQLEEIIERIKKGKFTPDVYELGPGDVVRWTDMSGPETRIGDNKVTHIGKEIIWTSTRLHRRKGWHVFGRLAGDLRAGYTGVSSEGKIEPVGKGPMRILDEFNPYISRFHGILAPHPEEEGKFLYVHFGRSPPKIGREG